MALNEDINPDGQFNTLRSDPYHRLDLNATYKFETGNRFQHTVKLGIFNLYNRKNTLYHEGSSSNGPISTENLKSVSLLPFLPSIQYSLKF